MVGPHDKSDVNNAGQSQKQSQEQNPVETPSKKPRDTDTDIERGAGNGVNEANTGTRRTDGSEPLPLYRHHPPPAQQSSGYARKPF